MSEVTDIVRKVLIKSGLNTFEDITLRFRIWSHNQNLLKIDISNDNNPLFQCFIEITETKFKEIREGQDINISSLENLKAELIKLFLRCEARDDREARFFLLLEEAGQSAAFQGYDIVRKKQLKIVEKSALKNLVHFTFDVVEATDSEIKTALIGQIDGLKNLYHISEAKVNELELKLLESRDEVNSKSNELAALRREFESRSTDYENEKRELITEVGEREFQIKQELEQKFKNEKEDYHKQHKSEVDQLKRQLKEFRSENKLLKQNLDELQASFQNESQRCGILEVKLENTQQEIEQLKSNNAKLDIDYHGKEKSVNTLRTRLAVCEQELKDKSAFIASLQKQTDKAICEKEYVQKYVEDLEKKLAFKDETVSKLAKDILKANEIIARQAAEFDSLKDKVKVTSSKALEQEKVLKQNGEEICRLVKELETENNNVEKLMKEKEVLSKEIEIMKDSLAMCKKKADIDSKVIAWFSRTLRVYSSPDSKAQITNSTPLSDIGGASARAVEENCDALKLNVISRVTAEGYGNVASQFTTSERRQENEYLHWEPGSRSGNSAHDNRVPEFVLNRLSDIQDELPVNGLGKRPSKNQNHPMIYQENVEENSHKFLTQADGGIVMNLNRNFSVPSSKTLEQATHKNNMAARSYQQPIKLTDDRAPLESDRSGSRKSNSKKDKDSGRDKSKFPGSSSYFQ